jgi:hypothetical protein
MTDTDQALAPAKPARSDESLKSLTKVSRVLDCFDTAHRSLTLAEICARTGYPRSTTHRLLAAMREVGFIEQERERDAYRLGLRLFDRRCTPSPDEPRRAPRRFRRPSRGSHSAHRSRAHAQQYHGRKFARTLHQRRQGDPGASARRNHR